MAAGSWEGEGGYFSAEKVADGSPWISDVILKIFPACVCAGGQCRDAKEKNHVGRTGAVVSPQI